MSQSRVAQLLAWSQMGLGETWNNFLAWSDEKGLPVSKFAYWLEDHGIPSLPAFAAFIAVILLFAYFFIAPALGTGLLAQTGKVKILAVGLDGNGIEGVNVSLTANDSSTFESVTDSGGTAKFASVPPGPATIQLSSVNYIFSTTATAQINVIAGKEVQPDNPFTGTALSANLVVLSVDVSGADNANIYLLDSNGVEIDKDFTFHRDFEVEPNKEYIVRAALEGYSPIERRVSVGSNNQQVSLALKKIGELDTATLHVGVFDSVGADGNPVANASVSVVELASSKVLATLSTGEDGTADAVDIPIGTMLEVTASAPGFAAKTIEVNASTDVVNLKIRLEKPVSAAVEVTISVVDENGDAVASPIVTFFEKNTRQELIPIDGVAVFNSTAQTLENVYATVFKPGFLPLALKSLKRGDNNATLVASSDANSGVVGVRVLDKNGFEVGGAFVSLLSEDKKFLGVPGRVTGADGLQSFEGVPLGTAIAVASMQTRVVFSDPFTVLSKTDAPNGTEVELRFPPANARLDVYAIDSFSKKPVSGAVATVFGDDNASAGSCTTNALGKCRLELLEQDAAFAQISASGYEDFESTPFAIEPGVANKQEFALMPRAPGSGRMVFLGYFDLAGNKVSELKPFTTYNARFQLKGSGTQFDNAVAHIRVDGLERSLDQEPIEIVAYTAVGARVTRGVAYEELASASAYAPTPTAQATAQASTPAETQVQILDFGFSPADVQVDTGSRVVFTNVGNLTHSIVFDKPFVEGGVVASSRTLRQNESFTVTIPVTGTFGFHCGLHPGEVGSVTALPKSVEETSVQTASGGAEEGAGATAFKWIEFSFQPFQGTRDLLVQFKTKQRLGEKTSFEYRAAFYGKDGSVLREPADAEAGKTKPEVLAQASTTPEIAIGFGGDCENDFCLNAFFEGAGTRASTGFEALLGKEFKLDFKALKGVSDAVSLKLSTDSAALVLTQGALGNGASTQTFPPTTAAANQSSEGAGVQEIVVPLKDAESNGFFLMQSRRLSKDSVLSLTATDSKNNVLFEKQFFVRVVSPTAPVMKVTVKPASVTALQETALLFKVFDSFGQPVDNARVTLESDLLQGGSVEADASGDAAAAARGEYKVSVNPSGVGTLSYSIESDGFRKKQGTIAVNAPSEAITIEPAKIQLTVDKIGEEADARIVITNKLSNEARVSLRAFASATPDYTEFMLVPDFVRVAGKASQEIALSAKTLDSVLAIASSSKPATLHERVDGKIVATASFGGGGSGGSSAVEAGFTINTAVEQTPVDDSWSVEKSSLDLQVNADKEKTHSETVRVTNNGDYPLLINQEISLEAASVDPLSAVIQSGESADFTVTARVPSSDCLMEDASAEGTLSFYGGFQGISSKKVVTLTRKISSASACKPKNGFEARLPLAMSFFLPSGTLTKNNDDGSTSLRLPSGEFIFLDSGASVTQTQATLPANTRVVLDKSRALLLPNGLQVSMPFDLRVDLPSDAELLQQSGALVVKAGNAVVSFPAGTQLSAGGIGLTGDTEVGGRTAFVPANAPIRFEAAAFSQLLSVIPSGALELKLPVNALLFLPSGTSIVKPSTQTSAAALPSALSSYSGVQGARLPTGELIAFGSETSFTQPTATGVAGAALTANVPAESLLLVSPNYVKSLSSSPTNPLELESFSLALPFAWSLFIPATARSPTRDSKTGLYSIKVSEDAVLQFNFDPSPKAATAGTSKQVFVNAFAQVIFLKGANATQFEDPTETSPCLQTFVANEEVVMEFPTGTRFLTEGSKITAVMQDCSDSTKIRIMSKTTGDELYESAASKRVEIDSGELQGGDASDFASLHSVTAPRNTKIVFKTCQKVSDESKEITLVLTGLTTLVLPEGADATHGLTVIDLHGYKKIKLFDASGRSYELSQTNKIVFEFPASGPDAKEVAALQSKESREVTLPAKTRIKFIPYCDKASAGTLEVRTDANTLGFKPSELSFELNNDKESDTQTTCIQNIGASSVAITDVNAVASAGKDAKGLIQKALPSDSEHMHFQEAEKYGKAHTASIAPSEACAHYDITAVIPDDARIKDQYGCVREGIAETIEGKILFSGRDVDGNELTPKGVDASITISGKGKCAQREASKAAAELYAVSVSRASLYYKDAGHTLYFAIKNNWREDVSVHVENPRKIISCHDVDSKQDLEQVASIPAGNALVVECVSLKNGDGLYTLKFGAQAWEKEQTQPIQVTVFKPADSLKAMYSATPIGDVLIEKPEDLGITQEEAAKQNLKLAPDSALETLFFKDAAGPAAAGAGAANAGTTGAGAGSSPAVGQQGQPPAGQQAQQEPQQPVFDKSFEFCEIHFCTLAQAQNAFKAFLASVASVANEETSDAKSMKATCDYISNRKWVKSFALQLTNTRLDATRVFKLFDDELLTQSKTAQGLGLGGISWSTETPKNFLQKTFSGCGIYVVTARLNPHECILSKPLADQRKDFILEVDAVKKVDCPETIANAPLLMPPDDTDLTAGNRIVVYPPEFKEFFAIFKGKFRSMTIGLYANESSAADQKTAGTVFAALYGSSLKRGVYASTYYEDLPKCFGNLKVPLFTLASFSVGSCVAAVAVAVASGGTASNVALQLCSVPVKTIPTCLMMSLGPGTNCDRLNRCVFLGLAELADSVVGAIFPATRITNFKQWYRDVGWDVATQGGLAGALALLRVTPDPALVYFGGKGIRLIAGSIWMTTKFQSNVDSIAADFKTLGTPTTKTGVPAAEAANANEIFLSDPKMVANAKLRMIRTRLPGAPYDEFYQEKVVEALARKSPATITKTEEDLLLEALKNKRTVITEAELSKVGVVAPTSYAAAELPAGSYGGASTSSYNELLFADAAAKTTTAEAGAQKPSLLKSLPVVAMIGVPLLLTAPGIIKKIAHPGGASTTAAAKQVLESAKTGSLSSFTSNFGRTLKAALPQMGAAAVVLLLFNVNGKPVRAELSEAFSSHVLALHKENVLTSGTVPSMRGYCFVQESNGKKDCVDEKDLTNACPSGNKACIIMTRGTVVRGSTQEQAGLNGFVFITSVNDDKTKLQEIIESIVKADKAPVDESVGKNVLVQFTNAAGAPVKQPSAEEQQKTMDALIAQTSMDYAALPKG